MDNSNERILGRTLARELTAEEIELVAGGTCAPCTCAVGGGTDYCADQQVQ